MIDVLALCSSGCGDARLSSALSSEMSSRLELEDRADWLAGNASFGGGWLTVRGDFRVEIVHLFGIGNDANASDDLWFDRDHCVHGHVHPSSSGRPVSARICGRRLRTRSRTVEYDNPTAPCSSSSRAQIRRAVWRCFFGASRSLRNMASIAVLKGSTRCATRCGVFRAGGIADCKAWRTVR